MENNIVTTVTIFVEIAATRVAGLYFILKMCILQPTCCWIRVIWFRRGRAKRTWQGGVDSIFIYIRLTQLNEKHY